MPSQGACQPKFHHCRHYFGPTHWRNISNSMHTKKLIALARRAVGCSSGRCDFGCDDDRKKYSKGVVCQLMFFIKHGHCRNTRQALLFLPQLAPCCVHSVLIDCHCEYTRHGFAPCLPAALTFTQISSGDNRNPNRCIPFFAWAVVMAAVGS